jgi:transcription antitermination protein NusB
MAGTVSGAGAPDPGAPSRRRSTGRRTDTRDPRRSRERALKILFQADVRGEAADTLLARIVDDPRAWAMLDDLDPEDVGEGDPPIGAEADDVRAGRRRRHLQLDGFTRSLVSGVAEHREELDELVQRYARRWTVARMPAIDRNLLRLGAYELVHERTSPAVVINEVIELAKRLSTEDSGRYVNGVLEAVRRHLAEQAQVVPDGRSDEDVPPPPPAEGGPGEDVLPPPDEEGDAVDLVPPVEPDPEPDEPGEAEAAEDEVAEDRVVDAGAGAADQQQLF